MQDLLELARAAASDVTVVDVHGHLGRSHSTGVRSTAAGLLGTMDTYSQAERTAVLGGNAVRLFRLPHLTQQGQDS